jgi:hypothetical protein
MATEWHGSRSGARTEDEFFRRGKHVDGECDLVLINLHTHPADETADQPENRTHDCDWLDRSECVDLGVDVCLGAGKVFGPGVCRLSWAP